MRTRILMLLALLFSGSAIADQSPLFSPNTGTVSGLQLTNNFNSALNALATCNSGGTAPVNQLSGAPSAGNCWLDTSATPYRVKTYDGASWLLIGYLDTTNHVWTPVFGGGAINSVASAATTDLCSTPPAFLQVTGTTTITSFGANCAIGQIKVVKFTGALILTHNGTSLILPNNGSNITTAAGDQAIAVSLGSGNWSVVSFMRASGQQVGTSANRVLLNTLTASNSVSLQDTTSFTNTYSEYEIVIENYVAQNNSTTLELQVHSGGAYQTASYLTSGNSFINGGAGSGVFVSGYIPVSISGINSNVNGTNAVIRVSNPSVAGAYKQFYGTSSMIDASTRAVTSIFMGAWTGGTGAIDGFQIFEGSGNITSGVVKVYGWN